MTVFSGEVYMAPIIVPMEPTRLTPSTTHGFADINLTANPDLKRDRAARAVRPSPTPVYWKLELRYDLSAGERESRVSRLKKTLTATIVPATVP